MHVVILLARLTQLRKNPKPLTLAYNYVTQSSAVL